MSYYKNRFKPLTSEPPLDPPEDMEEEELDEDTLEARAESQLELMQEKALERDYQDFLDRLYNTRRY